MTKQGFLEQLKGSLKGISSGEVNDILADYEEHFAAGATGGKSEEEIAGALGNPKTIGRSYRVDAALKRDKPQLRGVFSAVFASVSLGFFNIVFVLGPFLALAAVLIALWAAAFAVGIAGIAVILGIILQPPLHEVLTVSSCFGNKCAPIGEDCRLLRLAVRHPRSAVARSYLSPPLPQRLKSSMCESR